jgi:hypothetical protein
MSLPEAVAFWVLVVLSIGFCAWVLYLALRD